MAIMIKDVVLLPLELGLGSQILPIRASALIQKLRTSPPEIEESGRIPVGPIRALRARMDVDRYLQRLDAFESGPFTTDFQKLLDAGVELPEPDSLDDEHLSAKLWEVIPRWTGQNRQFVDTAKAAIK